MAEEILDQKIVQKLLSVPGRCRGLAAKDNIDFIVSNEGEGGVAKVEEAMVAAGCPFRIREIKGMDFYPLGLETIMLLAMKKVFNYSDEKFYEVGISNARQSLVVRVFAKYFISLKKMFTEASKMWRRYYDNDNFRPIRLDERKKEIVLRIENFNLHPLHCQVFKGYFTAVVKMIVGRPVRCQETSCAFKDSGNIHEFFITW